MGRTRLYRVTREQQVEAGCSSQLLQKGTCSSLAHCSGESRSASCSLARDTGPCRGAFRRWYFDSKTGKCQEFFFGGCRGNQNNFIKYADCERDCSAAYDAADHQNMKARLANPVSPAYLNDGFKDALDI